MKFVIDMKQKKICNLALITLIATAILLVSVRSQALDLLPAVPGTSQGESCGVVYTQACADREAADELARQEAKKSVTTGDMLPPTSPKNGGDYISNLPTKDGAGAANQPVPVQETTQASQTPQITQAGCAFWPKYCRRLQQQGR